MCTNEMERWVELQKAINEKERKDEVPRTARIAANKARWEAARLRDASETDTADMVITTELTEPAVQPPDTPSSSVTSTVRDVEEDGFLPNFHSSLSYPSESPTSKEPLKMVHDTVGTIEKTKAAVDRQLSSSGERLGNDSPTTAAAPTLWSTSPRMRWGIPCPTRWPGRRSRRTSWRLQRPPPKCPYNALCAHSGQPH